MARIRTAPLGYSGRDVGVDLTTGRHDVERTLFVTTTSMLDVAGSPHIVTDPFEAQKRPCTVLFTRSGCRRLMATLRTRSEVALDIVISRSELAGATCSISLTHGPLLSNVRRQTKL